MQVDFPSAEVANFERQMSVASEAVGIIESAQWSWIKVNILGALEEKAILTLKHAGTEEERVKAQQMFIASHMPQEILERLIMEGKAAKIALEEISNPLKEGEE